jgi:FixJ family two-component response regulator
MARLSGFDTETFASAEDALKGLGRTYPGIVVSDVRMPAWTGMQLLARSRASTALFP